MRHTLANPLRVPAAGQPVEPGKWRWFEDVEGIWATYYPGGEFIFFYGPLTAQDVAAGQDFQN